MTFTIIFNFEDKFSYKNFIGVESFVSLIWDELYFYPTFKPKLFFRLCCFSWNCNDAQPIFLHLANIVESKRDLQFYFSICLKIVIFHNRKNQLFKPFPTLKTWCMNNACRYKKEWSKQIPSAYYNDSMLYVLRSGELYKSS